jgi:antitoxin ParD1/3/4
MSSTLHISLPDVLEKKIQEQVKTGMYQTASEVVREALRLFFREPKDDEVMSYAMQKTLKEIDAGNETFVSEPNIMSNVMREVDKKKTKR